MPRKPSHVPKPSKRIVRVYAAAIAEGATQAEILNGAHRCKAYHVARYGAGTCAYAPSPLTFLQERAWLAAWELTPQKRKRSIDPNEGQEARKALLDEMRRGAGAPNGGAT